MKNWRRIATIIVAVMAIFTFSMCSDDDEDLNYDTNNQYFSTTKDIRIYKEDVVQYISEEIVDGSSIVFDGSIPDEVLPKKNSHIYIPVSEKTPYGVLAKVKSIQKGEKVSVEIEPLSLDEAFEFLSIDETTPVECEFEGVFDESGLPLEYEIVDSTKMNLNDTIINRPIHTRGFKSFKFDEDCVKIPVKFNKTENEKDIIEVLGTVYVGFSNSNINIDIDNNRLKYVNLNTTPYVKLGLSSKVATGSKLEISERLGQIRFRITIPTPVGIPIIIPVTTYVYGTCGIKGELSATLGLQYEYNCNCVATFKDGQWTSNVTHGGFNNKSPWTVGEFDVKGEIYSGSKIGLLVGLYSATSGIGFNVEPKLSLATQAKLSSEDLLKTNPEVELSLKAGSEVYCVAGLFGKQTAKYSMQFPDFTLWSQTTYLLPNITDFTAVGSSTSADISWWHDPFYFLELAGLKTGTTIYESDGMTEVDSYIPSPSSTTYEKYSYNVNATGLNAGKTYYAVPFVYCGDYKWYGEKEEFTTEARYKVSVTANGGGVATVSKSEVKSGETVTLTATANSRYEFENWTTNGNVVSTQNPYTVTITSDTEYVANFKKQTNTGPRTAVDLGLSVKWATCNVGATTPEEYGDYFAWGETTPKTTYDWSTYKYCNGTYDSMTKYCRHSNYGTVDNKTVLELSDDAARANWGGSWRMPTKAEQDELRDTNNCTWTWTTQNGVKGYKVTSKKNGNSIFLPAAGCRYGSGLGGVGGGGDYWSSSLGTSYSYYAYFVGFYSSYVYRYYNSRYYGLSVRAVCE